MLAALIVWLYTFLVLAGWGLGCTRLLRRYLPGSGAQFSLPEVVLWGFAAVTTLAGLLSLFAPTGLFTTILLILGALAGIWSQRRVWPGLFTRLHPAPLASILGVVTVVSVLNAATLPASNPDTGIYHAQAVHWIESYPAVPGLGNFYTRLAYNSNWFVATAAFSLSFLGLRSFHLSTSVFFLTAMLYFLQGVKALLRGQVNPAAILKTAFFPLATYLLSGDISSPATDLPAVLLVWICVILYVDACFGGPDQGLWNDLLVAVLAALAVTVKLSALPLILLVALRLFRRNRGSAAAMVTLAGVVLLPWLARNVILSGYLVFPALEIDPFRLDWRMPLETVRLERVGILSYARLPRLPRSEVEAMPLAMWARLWFENLTVNRQLAFLAAAFSPALAALTVLVGRVKRRNGRSWESTPRILPGWMVVYFGFWFWFLSAPAMRFGYGFLATAPLLAALPLLDLIARRLAGRTRWLGVVIALILIFYQGITLAQSLDAASLPARLALPADYTNLPTEPCKTEHLSATCASQWQECGYTLFPCAPGLNPRVVLRGEDWGAGFRSLDAGP